MILWLLSATLNRIIKEQFSREGEGGEVGELIQRRQDYNCRKDAYDFYSTPRNTFFLFLSFISNFFSFFIALCICICIRRQNYNCRKDAYDFYSTPRNTFFCFYLLFLIFFLSSLHYAYAYALLSFLT